MNKVLKTKNLLMVKRGMQNKETKDKKTGIGIYCMQEYILSLNNNNNNSDDDNNNNNNDNDKSK